MKIDLKKPPKEKKEFNVEYKDGISSASFVGVFFYKAPFLVVEGSLKGNIEVVCDLSGEKFFDELDDDIKIKVVEGAFKGFDELYDIIESDDGVFDFDSFLEGEIELFKNDYHKKEEVRLD